jgi:hypothetical protein
MKRCLTDIALAALGFGLGLLADYLFGLPGQLVLAAAAVGLLLIYKTRR